jgi:hypothetical protein
MALKARVDFAKDQMATSNCKESEGKNFERPEHG